jgi:hypothetical protein
MSGHTAAVAKKALQCGMERLRGLEEAERIFTLAGSRPRELSLAKDTANKAMGSKCREGMLSTCRQRETCAGVAEEGRLTGLIHVDACRSHGAVNFNAGIAVVLHAVNLEGELAAVGLAVWRHSNRLQKDEVVAGRVVGVR